MKVCRYLSTTPYLKPRQRQFGLLLSSLSFGQKSDSGQLDLERLFHRLRPSGWKRREVRIMLEDWRRAGWLAVDAVVFRLAPDRLPGWNENHEPGDSCTPDFDLEIEDHVATEAAKISQAEAQRKFLRSENFSAAKISLRSSTYIHAHDHVVHACNSMSHAVEVGALGRKTGKEILERVLKAAPGLNEEYRKAWQRRITKENARLVWELATEALQRHDLKSKAGWMNGAYLRELGVK